MQEQSPFKTHFYEYDAWFDDNKNIYKSELLAVKELLPDNGKRVEIGVGSGRFASQLGIDTGIEPVDEIADLARKRGIKVLQGKAESLPLEDDSIDSACLITTICFVSDIDLTFREVFRVLRPGGTILVGFVPKDSQFGELYEKIAPQNQFYKHATFYTKQEVFYSIEAAGFSIDRTIQSLTGKPDTANDSVEEPTEGHDTGSFIVIRGVKRDKG
jgi:ubiquinone/menaquinone biosynthesis C-methylase UbiE